MNNIISYFHKISPANVPVHIEKFDIDLVELFFKNIDGESIFEQYDLLSGQLSRIDYQKFEQLKHPEKYISKVISKNSIHYNKHEMIIIIRNMIFFALKQNPRFFTDQEADQLNDWINKNAKDENISEDIVFELIAIKTFVRCRGDIVNNLPVCFQEIYNEKLRDFTEKKDLPQKVYKISEEIEKISLAKNVVLFRPSELTNHLKIKIINSLNDKKKKVQKAVQLTNKSFEDLRKNISRPNAKILYEDFMWEQIQRSHLETAENSQKIINQKKFLEVLIAKFNMLYPVPEEIIDALDQWSKSLNAAGIEQKLMDQIEDERPEFICPITHEVMKDPVKAPDGHSYERTELDKWLKKSPISPLTLEPMKAEFKSDEVLRGKISKFIEESREKMQNKRKRETSVDSWETGEVKEKHPKIVEEIEAKQQPLFGEYFSSNSQSISTEQTVSNSSESEFQLQLIDSIAKYPKNTKAYYKLGCSLPPDGFIQMRDGKKMTVIQLFLKAIELAPGFTAPYFNLASILSNNNPITLNNGSSMTKQQLIEKASQIEQMKMI